MPGRRLSRPVGDRGQLRLDHRTAEPPRQQPRCASPSLSKEGALLHTQIMKEAVRRSNLRKASLLLRSTWNLLLFYGY
jgi:hypothetical protein